VRSWVASSEPTAQLKPPGTRFDRSFYEFAMHMANCNSGIVCSLKTALYVSGNVRVGLRVPTFHGQPTLRPRLAPTWHSVQCPLKLSGPSWLIDPALGFRFESHPYVAGWSE